MMFPKRANPTLYERIFEIARQAGVGPVELHHYMAANEVLQLIAENFGVAFIPKGIAMQLQSAEVVARPLESPAFPITSYLILNADQLSRLVNAFGRAFLKKIITNPQQAAASGQLFLEL